MNSRTMLLVLTCIVIAKTIILYAHMSHIHCNNYSGLQSTHVVHTTEKQQQERKKNPMNPALSAEFVTYFLGG